MVPRISTQDFPPVNIFHEYIKEVVEASCLDEEHRKNGYQG
jgi:hypothetical protein